MTPAVLELKQLAVAFRTTQGEVPAVSGVSWQVAAGEVMAIVGESGSGKSVTALAIMGLLAPETTRVSGQIYFAGQALIGLPSAARRALRGREMAMIFQDPMTALNPVLTIGTQMAESLRLHLGLSAEAARSRSLELLDRVGIADGARRLTQYPYEFSGGMRQRVMIAIALACSPRLIIADEATTALDVTLQAQVLDLLLEVVREHGIGLVLITHNFGVVAQYADRVGVMYAGQMVEVGTVSAVLAQAQHPYTQGLLRAVPRIDGPLPARMATIEGLAPDLRQTIAGCRFAPRCAQAVAQCASQSPTLGPVITVAKTAATRVSDLASAGSAFGDLTTGSLTSGGLTLSGVLTAGVKTADAISAGATLTIPDESHQVACYQAGPAPSVDSPEDIAPPTPMAAGLAPEPEILLQVSDLKIYFNAGARLNRAVDGVSLAVYRGETLGLVGESGCGKTTLGRGLLRLLPLSGGRMRYAATDVTTVSGAALMRYRRQVQVVFQDPYGALNPRQTIGAMIAEPIAVHRLRPAAQIAPRVAELLAQVGLSSAMAARYPHALSGGQRQRAGIARALALAPELLIWDEAVSALDVSVQAQIINLIKNLQKELGLTSLFIAHDLAVVRQVANRVVVMYLGRIVELADTATLFAQASHPYTQALLAAVPRWTAGARLEPLLLTGEVPAAVASMQGCGFAPRCPRASARCWTEAPALHERRANQQVACHDPS